MQEFSPIQYIMIDISNAYGMDKCSWQERISWVANNDSTLEYQDIDADNPILYSKAVRAYREAQAGNPIGHMVSLDATSSGIAIMAILMRCERTAKRVNLIDTGKREDVYSYIGDKMGEDRDKIKKPLMVYFYGGTAAIKELFNNDKDKLNTFYNTLKRELPGAYNCMSILQSLWNSKASHHTFTAPDGHIAYIPVMDKEKKRIKIGDTSFTHIANVNKPIKDGLALAANATHLWDGYIVREMVRKSKEQGYDLIPIHDDFYCHPNYMQQTRENYLSIIIDMAKQPIMCNWIKEMGGNCTEDSQAVIDTFVSKLESAEYFLS